MLWHGLINNLTRGAQSFGQIRNAIFRSATAAQRQKVKLLAGYVSEEIRRFMESSGWTPGGFQVVLPDHCSGIVTRLVQRRFARRLWNTDSSSLEGNRFVLRMQTRGAFRPLEVITVSE